VTVLIAAVAFALLWFGRTRSVAQLLGSLVAVMGVAFLITAWQLEPSWPDLLRGAVLPRFPEGSSLLILGLVGTTVVPYNLFMGSGLARGADLREVRFGLAVSIVLGGLISMGILVVGVAVDGPFGFDTLTEVLTLRLGSWSRVVFGTGLFAAGLTSAITAPFAAALTARSVFGEDNDGWSDRSWRFRVVWGGVLGVGVLCGLAEIRPIPAILAAQAMNGVMLPFVAVFLLLAVNDVRLIGAKHANGCAANVALIAVVAVTILLGLTGVIKALAIATGWASPGGGWLLVVSATLTALIFWPVARRLRENRAVGDPG
jgi:Mn2+/Fe2+ NRAMP family transporter